MERKQANPRRPGRRSVIVGGLLAAAALGLPARRSVAAQDVNVWSTTDRLMADPLIEDFERRHPGLRVDYRQLGSVELAERFAAEEGREADVVWSSAMDLQVKLVNDGHAARHLSRHAAALPRWAVWKHEAYATTSEPVGIAYHRGLWAEPELPRTHAALAALLQAERQRFDQRVASYDVERSGLGYLLAAQDSLATPQYWTLVRALGACRAVLQADTGSMLEDIAAGRTLLAYNVLGSYVEAAARARPELAIVYPRDYTLLAARVAFVARSAPHPGAARAWLDHLISPRGQQVLASDCGLTPVLPGAGAAPRLGEAARPIGIGPGLLVHLDRSKRGAFIARWKHRYAGTG
ncbi:MAG: ABC transporter substrate-binding protein [Piscinibacter sp.]|uniref:ABC transporter substrate-binding protein n=1 Tax=Piscinibacter TaxID=1114981 RepID=UPI000FDEB7E2|nr:MULTISPECIES: ABC transporter substrate-binding protein [Piscinibacter]MCW5666419.1 ABC transporter substrate-binding protein [Piscinibacter sp.]